MANLTITAADVALVRAEQSELLTLPTAEAITAGQYVRSDTTGLFALGNATSAAEAGKGYLALRTASFVGDTITAIRRGLVNLGSALSGMALGAKVYLSATDGTLADADPARNEQQTVTISGAPTGGTFTLTYAGQTTAAIAYDAAASAVQTALEALSTIRAGNVKVTGSAGGPYTVEFQNALGMQNLAAMTADGSSLTGGTDPDVAVAEAQAGIHSIAVGTVTPAWGDTTVSKLLMVEL